MAIYQIEKIDAKGSVIRHHQSFADEHSAFQEAYRLARTCNSLECKCFDLIRVTPKARTYLRTFIPPGDSSDDVKIVPEPH